jgi:AhpD family alkylhydroperoxidase
METNTGNPLEPLSIESTTGMAYEILSRVQKKMGAVHTMYLGMANNPALLDAYLYSLQSFWEHSGFTPREQEVIFLSISVENGCEYCVAAHSFIADKISHVPRDIIHAIRNNTEISDPKLKYLSLFARAITAKRGYPSGEDLDDFYEAGYSAKDILGVIAAVGVQTFSNYFNHFFHTELDKKFTAWAWKKESEFNTADSESRSVLANFN